MSMGQDVGVLLGGVKVYTTVERGFTPEEIADRALDKIIYVGEQSHPVIREQAQVFKDSIRAVLVFYLREAQQSERTNIIASLTKQGFEDMAQLIRRI
jgi:hypothetical protein